MAKQQLETFCHDKCLGRIQIQQLWMDIFLGNELNLIRRKKNTSDVVGNLNSSMSFCHCKSIGYRLHCLTKHDSGGQMVLEIRYEELDNVNKAYFTVFPWLSVTVIQM